LKNKAIGRNLVPISNQCFHARVQIGAGVWAVHQISSLVWRGKCVWHTYVLRLIASQLSWSFISSVLTTSASYTLSATGNLNTQQQWTELCTVCMYLCNFGHSGKPHVTWNEWVCAWMSESVSINRLTHSELTPSTQTWKEGTGTARYLWRNSPTHDVRNYVHFSTGIPTQVLPVFDLYTQTHACRYITRVHENARIFEYVYM